MEIGQKEKKCIYGCKVVYKQNRYIKNENSTFTLIIDTKQHINFKHIESDMSSVSPDHNGKIRGKKGNISFIIYLKVSSFFYSKMSSIILSSIWTFIFFMVLNTFEESFAVSSWKWQKTKSLKRSFVNLDRFFFHVFILFKYFPKIIWFFFFPFFYFSGGNNTTSYAKITLAVVSAVTVVVFIAFCTVLGMLIKGNVSCQTSRCYCWTVLRVMQLKK